MGEGCCLAVSIVGITHRHNTHQMPIKLITIALAAEKQNFRQGNSSKDFIRLNGLFDLLKWVIVGEFILLYEYFIYRYIYILLSLQIPFDECPGSWINFRLSWAWFMILFDWLICKWFSQGGVNLILHYWLGKLTPKWLFFHSFDVLDNYPPNLDQFAVSWLIKSTLFLTYLKFRSHDNCVSFPFSLIHSFPT